MFHMLGHGWMIGAQIVTTSRTTDSSSVNASPQYRFASFVLHLPFPFRPFFRLANDHSTNAPAKIVADATQTLSLTTSPQPISWVFIPVEKLKALQYWSAQPEEKPNHANHHLGDLCSDGPLQPAKVPLQAPLE